MNRRLPFRSVLAIRGHTPATESNTKVYTFLDRFLNGQ